MKAVLGYCFKLCKRNLKSKGFLNHERRKKKKTKCGPEACYQLLIGFGLDADLGREKEKETKEQKMMVNKARDIVSASHI